MRFFETLLTGAALVAAALAVEINNFPAKVEPGKTYEITWSPKDNTPTTFKLRTGPGNNLDPAIATLTTSATGGSFEWTFDGSIPDGDNYALEISQQGGAPNYAATRIEVSGSDAVASSSAVSSSASATSASATAKKSSAAPSSTLLTTATAPASASTSASASISPSASSNGTISSATLSRTASGTSAPTGASTTASGPPQSTGAASTLGSSPLALIFGAIAAMAYLN